MRKLGAIICNSGEHLFRAPIQDRTKSINSSQLSSLSRAAVYPCLESLCVLRLSTARDSGCHNKIRPVMVLVSSAAVSSSNAMSQIRPLTLSSNDICFGHLQKRVYIFGRHHNLKLPFARSNIPILFCRPPSILSTCHWRSSSREEVLHALRSDTVEPVASYLSFSQKGSSISDLNMTRRTLLPACASPRAKEIATVVENLYVSVVLPLAELKRSDNMLSQNVIPRSWDCSSMCQFARHICKIIHQVIHFSCGPA